MKPRDVFGVILKSIGVIFVIVGLQALPSAYRFIKHYPVDAEGGLSMVIDAVGSQAITVASGLLLVLATSWFVDMAYVREDMTGPNSN